MTPSSRRGRFQDITTRTDAGDQLHSVEAPRTEGVGRERARQAILTHLGTAAEHDQRVAFMVAFADRSVVALGGGQHAKQRGGYLAADALARARGEGDDPLAWLAADTTAIHPDLEHVPIVGVGILVWPSAGHQRTP